MQGIFHASFLLLHFGLGRGADIDNGNTAGELCQTLLQFFAIVVRSGFLDLTTDLVNSVVFEIEREVGAITPMNQTSNPNIPTIKRREQTNLNAAKAQ